MSKHDRDAITEMEKFQIQDRLLTSLFKDRNNHLSAFRQTHAVGKRDNCATLYFYMNAGKNVFGIKYVIQVAKLFNYKPLSYKQWTQKVDQEVKEYELNKGDFFFGWHTHFIKTNPIYTGDIHITVAPTHMRVAQYYKTEEGKFNARLVYSRGEIAGGVKNAKEQET